MAELNESKFEEKFAQMRGEEEENLVRMLSQKYSVPYIDLTSTPVNTDALRLIPEDRARNAQAALFNIEGRNEAHIAVISPAYPASVELIEEFKKRNYTVVVHMTSHASLENAWEKYSDLSNTTATERGSLAVSNEEISSFLSEKRTFQDVQMLIEETLRMERSERTSKIVEVFVAGALALDASDIHVEPDEANVRLRYRLDGILTDINKFDTATYKLLLSRIKLLSSLKLNVKEKAQDGRFSIKLKETEIEIRTSVIPSEYGESIVMRILDPENIAVPLEALGMRDELYNIMLHEVDQPNGLIITTGPTGSGKTTMLYAFLKKIYRPEIKIVTLEDPIEYHMSGIVQTQIEHKKGYTFAKGLRAILRQDPDVVMVGEMRDSETTKTAVNAALTGHVVFSTLHTNTAAGAIPRLVELGVDPRILPSALRAVMAQRLVRKLCEACKQRVPLTGDNKKMVEKVLAAITDPTVIKETQDRNYIYEAVGCEKCSGSGYKGRTGVYEAILMDEKVEDVLRGTISTRSIVEASKDQGILNMAQDGVVKVLNGVTSLDELTRVVELE